MGLSPLARGNRRLSGPCCRGKGPIPARAGQPGAAALLAALPGAYPRSRGATRQPGRPIFCNRGLSPLARGNLNACRWNHADRGPIPARAGQPMQGLRRSGNHRAYPRSRGATSALPAISAAVSGLSPLARGNLRHRMALRRAVGPIPARAGQPRRLRAYPGHAGAYPRSRGATSLASPLPGCRWGLSPLARGNPHGLANHALCLGPIPARAGQPGAATGLAHICWAYPRSRGATVGDALFRQGKKGLSPLARGNRWCGRLQCVQQGPIPARAGQPDHWNGARRRERAYPRSRGATGSARDQIALFDGLSPLARGNLKQMAMPKLAVGPIPARAGQPASPRESTHPSWAYPRSRGATRSRSRAAPSKKGLSPLARGNPEHTLYAVIL